MTREDPDQLKSDTAQGKIQEFDSPSHSNANGVGELGDFSLKMLAQLGHSIVEPVPSLFTFDEHLHQRCNR